MLDLHNLGRYHIYDFESKIGSKIIRRHDRMNLNIPKSMDLKLLGIQKNKPENQSSVPVLLKMECGDLKNTVAK